MGSDTGVEIVERGMAIRYDLAIDARGEAPAEATDLPFPTLRLQILANRMVAGGEDGELEVQDDLRLSDGVNPVERVYCLAAPFLLKRRPFVQGLTSAHEMAERAVERLLGRDDEQEPEVDLDALLNGGALYLGPDLIVTTPASAPTYPDNSVHRRPPASSR